MESTHLQAFTEEELLAELRSRTEGVGGAARPFFEAPLSAIESAQRPNALRDVPPRALFDAVTRVQIVRYGVDDRHDLCAVQKRDAWTQGMLAAADGVAALFPAEHVRDNGDGTSTLIATRLGARAGLCPDEPFCDQPAGAIATAFLVAPDRLATAGHCFTDHGVDDFRVVFGFRMRTATDANMRVSNQDVYRVTRIVGQQIGDADSAVFCVDRPVAGRAPLAVRREGRIADGASVYVLGHPSGLPLKYADNAVVRDNGPAPYFVANLDTYTGNSGSPVLGADHVVEGIVVRGERDFVQVGTCYRSLVCPDNGGRGQDCVRTTEIVQLLSGS